MPEQAIVVINAGSSSVKFSAYVRGDGGLDLRLRGQIEALFTGPRCIARDAAGKQMHGHRWPEGTQLGHGDALTHLIEFLRGRASGVQLIGVGHRVVHGGMLYARPARVDAALLGSISSCRSRRCTSRTISLRSAQSRSRRRRCRRSRLRHRISPGNPEDRADVRAAIRDARGECGATDSTASATNTSHRRCPPSMRGPPVVARWCCTWATARHVRAAGRRSVASTMGFTAVDSLPMGTRSGNLDPGVVLAT